jgi:hypothetical protein
MVEGYSKFFTFDELTDSEKHKHLVKENRQLALKYVNSGKRLSKLCETIREILGEKAIKVNSGFRSPKLNTAVGSKSKNSAHTRFEAVDLNILHMTEFEAFNKLKKAREDGLLPDLRKVLMEGSWLHVEVSMSVGDYRGFFVSKDGNKTWEKVA